MKKILFVDLDGTIRESITGKFIDTPDNQQIIPGAEHAVNHFYKRGWTIIGISNQGGIEYGYKSLNSCIEEMKVTLKWFPQLYRIYFCSDMQGHDCIAVDKLFTSKFSCDNKKDYLQLGESYPFRLFRKPDCGMLDLAIWDVVELPSEYFLSDCKTHDDCDCWMIGDRPEDEEAARNLGINFLAADVWRSRFFPGMHEITLTPRQLEFLEGIKLT